jgi:hypothetical protein
VEFSDLAAIRQGKLVDEKHAPRDFETSYLATADVDASADVGA